MNTRQFLPLICLALLHTTVDASALLIAPIWPELEQNFDLGLAALSVIFIVQSLPTSLSQGVFGYMRDRRALPYLLWLGPLMAAVCLTLVGVAPDRTILCVLLIVGGIGVGAFHPEAAVAAGQMIPGNRTRALSIFMLGGSLGLALGPIISGAVVNRWGLAGLVYLAPPVVLLIPLLAWGARGSSISRREPKRAASDVGGMLAGHAMLAVAILMICSFRLVPNMALDKVISFVIDQQSQDRFVTGLVQSLLLISGSLGMFLMALRFRTGWERAFLIFCPLASIPLLLVLGTEGCPMWLFITLLVPTGLILWGTMPAMVSYAQQLLPQGAGVASAITMGLSWGVGGLIQAPITAYFRSTGTPQHALLAFVPFLAIASLGSCFLPRITVTESSDEPLPVSHKRHELRPEPVDS